ncbi:Homeobox-leucine zipper protein 4 / HD-ZIP protein [Hibiscus syriacus]|uniref:Homeobox-leucine zipper protein 4 / HD-ZIP protein n=1 Tax=Hibiscus syriacus TaxID=106335 RepID=A0A6A3BFH2_HIBSY|nr:serine/arginine repetitive matrix protein 1-like [Hibiscus syriacus]KAE8713792.1 Homeobox-leucine zipper protein 4 / HD-ZIP protein [Hibiscus syriacus]
MADTNTCSKQRQLVKEQNPANPSKSYTNFLSKKVLVVIVFLVIIPVFPSQAPEFINQSLLNRSWELLRLLFVGIAVSYGLFSRRNDGTEKEINNPKLDNLQSLMSRFLHVSSVFDDEAENICGSDDGKVQTWSSQYYRIEPPVLVAKKQGEEKPLLLPVRSLKSRVLEGNNVETSGENIAKSGSLRRSNSSLSSIMENGETLVEKMNDSNVVLPSPIPWRSRSVRMEVKEDIESFRPQTTRLSSSKSFSSSPKKLSPSSTSSLTEIQAKTSEDLLRKKSIYRSHPPPPPPPPPPLVRKSSPLKRASSFTDDRVSFPRKFASKPNEMNGSFKPKPKPSFMEFPQGDQKQGFVETSDEDDDSESEEYEEVRPSTNNKYPNNEEEPSHSNGADGGSDVDKKADEFIAKVREQIRLQRIDSIKRSSGQIKRNSTR